MDPEPVFTSQLPYQVTFTTSPASWSEAKAGPLSLSLFPFVCLFVPMSVDISSTFTMSLILHLNEHVFEYVMQYVIM